MTARIVIVIPARYGSTRFPGKPLAMIHGRMLIQRVWEIASSVAGVDQVCVATDDERIAAAVAGFGGSSVMTDPNCGNGTERMQDALTRAADPASVAVNLQGDAVLTPPWILQALVDEMRADLTIQIATPAVRLSWAQYERLVESKRQSPYSGCLVTFGTDRNALYFSKNIIPAVRVREGEMSPVYQHIGIYAYRRDALTRYIALPTGRLEQSEGLEQLRALESGMPIRIVEVEYRGRTTWAIDSPSDIGIVESIIDREGELVTA